MSAANTEAAPGMVSRLDWNGEPVFFRETELDGEVADPVVEPACRGCDAPFDGDRVLRATLMPSLCRACDADLAANSTVSDPTDEELAAMAWSYEPAARAA